MSQLSDSEITDLCIPPPGRLAFPNDPPWEPMITPFVSKQITRAYDHRPVFANLSYPVLSYGTSCYGYDARLARTGLRVFTNAPGHHPILIDPKRFDDRLLVEPELTDSLSGTYFVIPANSYALGETVERFRIPRDILMTGVNKSTLARCGYNVNVTPGEPEWGGVLTLELANLAPAPTKVYVDEGICQFIFWRGAHPPTISYADRHGGEGGKYQNATGMALPKV